MVGVVVVGHGRLGEAFVATVEAIAGRQPRFSSVGTDETDTPEAIRTRIAEQVRLVDDGSGVVICTDMLGDTATNQSLAVAREMGAEVVAGVNMPMLMKLCTDRDVENARTVAQRLVDYGQDHICWATAPRPLRVAR